MSDWQYYWRCAHYTSAIQNFFERREVCDREFCHYSALRWHDAGVHPSPQQLGFNFDF